MKRSVVRFCATFAVCCLSAGFVRAAGGAFAVDDAAVEAVGVCKTETILASEIATNPDRYAVTTPACALAFGERRSEVAIGIGRRRAGDLYATPASLKFKTPLPGFDLTKLERFGAAISAGYFADLDDGKRRSRGYFVTVPASFQLNEMFLLNVNVGRSEFEHRPESFTNWGASIEMNLQQFGYRQITLVAETFTPRRSETAYQLGARYTPSATLDLDVLLGRNLGGEQGTWLTFGVTQRF